MNYLEFKQYKGKDNLYTLVNINCKLMNDSCVPDIKDEIIDYFISGKNNELTKDKYCLNFKKVKNTDASGLSALLIFSTLNKNHGNKGIVLANCPDNIKNLIKISQLEYCFEFADNLKEL